ncbi:MAG: hypothetical protein RMM51_09815 [Verrucomicrobiae bacterium]|nr:hypothetical protein [Verrucomicrobiae bacterium]
MSETSPSHGAAGLIVGYALNAFPCHTLEELWPVLRGPVALIKNRAFPRERFPIELRFSKPLVTALQQDERACDRLRDELLTGGLWLVTANAFVLPRFHGERVKERVYLPAWHESSARRDFTCASLDVLARLTEGDHHTLDFWSVSVPFGALKPVSMSAIAPNILACGEHARRLSERSGRRFIVALEPEPGLTVETTAEAVEFFENHVPTALRPYLGVNFDLGHQLVEFEEPIESVRQLSRAGIVVAKVHVSNAAELSQLAPFYRDSIYLHQTTGVDERGRRVFFSLDWPDTKPTGVMRYRVHYHLPVFPSALPSTLSAVEQFLRDVRPVLPATAPLIIETYTWPQQEPQPDQIVENICRELEWVRSKI